MEHLKFQVWRRYFLIWVLILKCWTKEQALIFKDKIKRNHYFSWLLEFREFDSWVHVVIIDLSNKYRFILFHVEVTKFVLQAHKLSSIFETYTKSLPKFWPYLEMVKEILCEQRIQTWWSITAHILRKKLITWNLLNAILMIGDGAFSNEKRNLSETLHFFFMFY